MVFALLAGCGSQLGCVLEGSRVSGGGRQGGQHHCRRQDTPDSIWESQSLIVSTCGRGHGCVRVCE